MKAVVDCNNFYCSCERLFRPGLEHSPVVVLSNNDGCVVSRSDEAKQLGVAMAVPYFLARPVIEKNNIAVFSSNYTLYGDLSWRVMESLRMLVGARYVEVYSVDEAFLNLDHVPGSELESYTHHIKNRVEQWTGIKVSIGVGPTKVLAKAANYAAKKNKQQTHCIVVLQKEHEINELLSRMPVGSLWGVGYRSEKKLREWGIYDALQLKNMSEAFARTHLGGVVGVRLIKELNGIATIQMKDALINKKAIATTRMFGIQVTDIQSIKEAIATYASRAAEKLRRQSGLAQTVSIFVVAKSEDNPAYGHTQTAVTHLPVATSSSIELIKAAESMVNSVFSAERVYKKAGVILSDIIPDAALQTHLFNPPPPAVHQSLMQAIDNINFSQRNDVLKFAAAGTTRNWKMRQEKRSPRYTTRWDELCPVR